MSSYFMNHLILKAKKNKNKNENVLSILARRSAGNNRNRVLRVATATYSSSNDGSIPPPSPADLPPSPYDPPPSQSQQQPSPSPAWSPPSFGNEFLYAERVGLIQKVVQEKNNARYWEWLTNGYSEETYQRPEKITEEEMEEWAQDKEKYADVTDDINAKITFWEDECLKYYERAAMHEDRYNDEYW